MANDTPIHTVDGRGIPRFGMVLYDDVRHPVICDLSPTAFRLWVLLTTYVNAQTSAWSLSRNALARDLCVDVRHIRRGLVELTTAGLLEVERRPGPKGGDGWNLYRLRRPRGGGADSAPRADSAPGADSARADFASPRGADSAPPIQIPGTDPLCTDPKPPHPPAPAGGARHRKPLRCELVRDAELRELADWLRRAEADCQIAAERQWGDYGPATLAAGLTSLVAEVRRQAEAQRAEIERQYRRAATRRGVMLEPHS